MEQRDWYFRSLCFLSHRITVSKALIPDLFRHIVPTLYYNFHEATNIWFSKYFDLHVCNRTWPAYIRHPWLRYAFFQHRVGKSLRLTKYQENLNIFRYCENHSTSLHNMTNICLWYGFWHPNLHSNLPTYIQIQYTSAATLPLRKFCHCVDMNWSRLTWDFRHCVKY